MRGLLISVTRSYQVLRSKRRENRKITSNMRQGERIKESRTYRDNLF
jgi:hypothetical protein